MEFIDAPVILDVPRDLFGFAVTDFLDLSQMAHVHFVPHLGRHDVAGSGVYHRPLHRLNLLQTPNLLKRSPFSRGQRSGAESGLCQLLFGAAKDLYYEIRGFVKIQYHYLDLMD